MPKPARTPIQSDAYLTTERSIILKQVDALYRDGYVNAGEAATLILKHTDCIRVEVPHARS